MRSRHVASGKLFDGLYHGEVERLNGQRRWGLELEDFAHSGPLDLPDGEPDGHTPDPCLGSLVPGDLPPVLVELHERILSDVLSSLQVPDNQEGRPYHRAVLILEENRVSVVDIGHRATLRLAGASDSPLLDDSLHIDPAK